MTNVAGNVNTLVVEKGPSAVEHIRAQIEMFQQRSNGAERELPAPAIEIEEAAE